MPYSPTGVFTPAVTFVDGTTATAEDQNTQDLDIASGLTAAATRAGLAAATANWPMGGFKLTGLGPGSASTDSVNYGQFTGATTTRIFWGGTSGGSANTQTVTVPGFNNTAGQVIAWVAGFGPNTTDTTLNGIHIYQQTSFGAPILLAGGEIQLGDTCFGIFNPALNSGAGGLQLVGIQSPAGFGVSTFANVVPQGRLTLTSGVPVLTSTVSAATSVIYTPYVGNQFPVWDATTGVFNPTAFSEYSQPLNDSTLSPAAGAASKVYDIFGWVHSGSLVFTRGPAWTNATTRGYTLTRTQGVLVNTSAITNGPAAGFGVYVGSVATDAGGATVSWIVGSGASGGTAAVFNVWNAYNRVGVGTAVTDTASYVVNAVGPRQAHGSAGMQVTWLSGLAEEDAFALYNTSGSSGTSAASWTNNIGLDSTSTYNGSTGGNTSNVAGVSTVGISYSSTLLVAPNVGQHFVAALETTTGTSITLNSQGNGSLSFRTRM